MARSGGARGRAGASRPRTGQPAAKPRRAPAAQAPRREEPRTLRLGAVAGATPGTWIGRWRERFPHVELVLVPLSAADQLSALEHDADIALVRLPVERDDLHVIPLYEEVTVAVTAADSHLTAADELELADLAGEVVIVPGDDVVRARVEGAVAPRFDAPEHTADAIATVAAGVGVVLVPLSLARLHARKDVEVRPVTDAPTSRIGLAWPRDRTTADVEAFVGIVRGRTANSSR